MGGGVGLSAVLGVGVFAASLATTVALDPNGEEPALVVEVVGYQYGWEARYPEAGVTVTDEVRMPAGLPVELRLSSIDVIHSFWVPELHGKLDMLPERVSTLVLEADAPGTPRVRRLAAGRVRAAAMTDTAPPNDSPVTDETLPTAEELHELWDDPPGLWGRICAVPWRRGPPARTGWSSKDDYDGELRYDRRPLRAVQALDPARVAFFGSASKALAPGLRVAWCVVPVDLVDDVLAAQASIGGPAVSRVEQLVLAELLRSGRYDAQVRRARAAYGHRRDMLVEAVERHVPSVRVEGVAA